MREPWVGRFFAVFALAVAIVVIEAAIQDSPQRPTAEPVERSTAAVGCDRFAAPGGDDASTGSREAPFATAQVLVDSLEPGQTGCLRAGSYSGVEVDPDEPGYRETKLTVADITLASFPGERARLENRLWVAASGVTVANLDLDGTNPPQYVASSLTIGGELGGPPIGGVRIIGNDITNGHERICVNLGTEGYGRPFNTVIEGNRIHDCGVYEYPPDATAVAPGREFTGHWNEDHGIYVGLADSTVIRRNLIYDNASRGIQLYPDSQGTHAIANVIDNNGEGVGIGGDEASASSNNIVERNVITASSERFNVEHNFGGCEEGAGSVCPAGNAVISNCLGADSRALDYVPEEAPDRAGWIEYYSAGGGLLDPGGVTNSYTAPINSGDPRRNVLLEPASDPYVDRANKDFRLAPDSSCRDAVGVDPAAGLDRWTAPSLIGAAPAPVDLGAKIESDGTQVVSWRYGDGEDLVARVATRTPSRPSMAEPDVATWQLASPAEPGDAPAGRMSARTPDGLRITVHSEVDPELGYERVKATVINRRGNRHTQTLSSGAVADAPVPALDPVVAVAANGTAIVAWSEAGGVVFAQRYP